MDPVVSLLLISGILMMLAVVGVMAIIVVAVKLLVYLIETVANAIHKN